MSILHVYVHILCMPAFRLLCSACNHACLISFFSSFQLPTPHTQDPTESLSPITHLTHSQSTPSHTPNNYCNRSPSLTKDTTIHAGEIGQPSNHPTHSQSTPSHAPNNYCDRSPSLTEDSTIRTGQIGVVRQPSLDTYNNSDIGMFSRNTSISSTNSIKLQQRPSSHIDGSMDAQDPENSIGYSAEHTEIVGSHHHTSEDEDELKPTQQREETGDNAKLLLRDRSVSLSDSLVGILRPKQRSEQDDASSKSCRLSNNSSLADSDVGSSIDSMTSPGEDLPSLEEPPSQPTMEKPLSFQDGPATAEGPHSMSDSASTLVGSESMPSFYSSSTTPTDVLQQFQTTQSSPSGRPTMTPVSPLPGPMSQAQVNEAMTRIDTCLAQNKDRVPVIDNFGKFVQHPSSSIQKTEEQLEAPYPFLPKGCIPDFDMDCIQACQLMASKEFGNREQLYYQQTLAEPLPEDEEDIERSLSHRDSVKQV